MILPTPKLSYCPSIFLQIILLFYNEIFPKYYDGSYCLPYHIKAILHDFQDPGESFLQVPL